MRADARIAAFPDPGDPPHRSVLRLPHDRPPRLARRGLPALVAAVLALLGGTVLARGGGSARDGTHPAGNALTIDVPPPAEQPPAEPGAIPAD